MITKCIEEDQYQKWNNFVENSPQGSIYSKTWYLDAFDANYKIFVVTEASNIIAGIIITKNEVGLYTNPLLSKYLGVMYHEFKGNKYNVESKKRKIINLLIPEIKKYKSFYFSFHPSFQQYLPFFWNGYKNTIRYTYWIDLLNKSSDEIFNNCYSNLKNEIKYGQKQKFEYHKNIDFDVFYEILNKSFKRQGSNAPWSHDKIKNYYYRLRNRHVFELNGIANKAGEIMAVNGILYDRQVSSLIFNGIDIEKIERGSNEILIYETIKSKIGISHFFDFEGSI